jgi:glycosyltransferase involved in cell wall biosynthesis
MNTMAEQQDVDVSVVIPIRNESENMPHLVGDLFNALLPTGYTFEIIFIDDGSTDNSWTVMLGLRKQHGEIRCVKFELNAGKSAALQAGFERARGRYILIMDGDRQNDPVDIPRFLEKLKDYDIVCGFRANRLDSKWRLIQSRIANRIRNRFTRDGVHDSGCGYQAFRRACLKNIKLYGGMHRFLPCLFQLEGFTLAQIPVLHHPRVAGVSNYPFWRRFRRATIDLFAVRWMLKRRIAFKVQEEC